MLDKIALQSYRMYKYIHINLDSPFQMLEKIYKGRMLLRFVQILFLYYSQLYCNGFKSIGMKICLQL